MIFIIANPTKVSRFCDLLKKIFITFNGYPSKAKISLTSLYIQEEDSEEESSEEEIDDVEPDSDEGFQVKIL